jgi:hypothetical protein
MGEGDCVVDKRVIKRHRGIKATRQKGNEAERHRGKKASRQKGIEAKRQKGIKATRQKGKTRKA